MQANLFHMHGNPEVILEKSFETDNIRGKLGGEIPPVVSVLMQNGKGNSFVTPVRK